MVLRHQRADGVKSTTLRRGFFLFAPKQPNYSGCTILVFFPARVLPLFDDKDSGSRFSCVGNKIINVKQW